LLTEASRAVPAPCGRGAFSLLRLMSMPSALTGLRAALGAPSRPPNRLRLIGLRAWRRCALRLRGAGADIDRCRAGRLS